MYTRQTKLLFSLTKALKRQSGLSSVLNIRQILQPIYYPCRVYSDKSRTAPKTSSLISPFISSNEQQGSSSEEEEIRKRRQASWDAVKYMLITFGASFACLGAYIVFVLGKSPVDADGSPIDDEFSNMPIHKRYFYRTLHGLHYLKRMIEEPSREKLLPDVVQYPFYQPPYTLVLEMTDVLVHPDWTYQTGWRFKKRPGVDQFLESLNGMFEIVVFTAEQGFTVFPIIDALDPNNFISYKLVRDATHFVDGHHVKNLSKLNRNLSKVIVVDWDVNNVKFHPENLFHLPRWNGSDDNTLLDLAEFLKVIAESEIEDVRDVLTHYNQFEDPLTVFKERQRQLKQVQEADKNTSVKLWFPSLLKNTS